MRRHVIALALNLALAAGAVIALGISAATLPPEGDLTGDRATIDRTMRERLDSAPPVWSTEALREAFPGRECFAVDVAPTDRIPVTHVIDSDHGIGVSLMPQPRVAALLGWAGGTPDPADDPEILGNCYKKGMTR